MNGETERALFTDDLTGLYNRRFLNRQLPEVVAEAKSSHKPMSLFILDVDYFKDLNDRDMYIKNVINNNTDKTGLFCTYNEDALLEADF